MPGTSLHEDSRSVLITPPAEAAAAALEQAAEFCRAQLAAEASPRALLQRGDPTAHDYFRHGLARRVAEYLAEADPMVRAVYLHRFGELEEEVGTTPVTPTTPLGLVIWVERKTAALESLLSDIDVSLTAGYRELVAPAADELGRLLDAHCVDDREVAARTGFGALIAATRERALRVWARCEGSAPPC